MVKRHRIAGLPLTGRDGAPAMIPTRDELVAIRERDQDYNDIFEQQATMPRDIAHRLVAWPVHDRRALLALVRDLAEKAGRVTCRRCDDSGYEPWSDFGGAVIEPCPDCAPLRELLEVVR